jgi:branched-chain amino acid transport system permease protein
MGLSRVGLAVFLGSAVLLCALPFVAEKFYVQLITKILVLAILAMSLDLVLGYAGLVSFGHAAFYGLAGYLLALSTPQYEAANFWISLPLSIAGSGLLAAAIGALVLRTSGVYFIMASLAFAQLVYYVFHDTELAGGSDGIYIYVRPAAEIAGWKPFDLENFTHLYFVVLAFFVGVFLFLRVVLGSLFGRVLAGIRVNEHRMRSLGYATFRYKLAAFVLSGMVAGVAGWLGAVQFGVVNPDFLGWHLSGSVMMMVILGGMGTLVGPAFGAFAMMLLEVWFQGLTKHWQLLLGTFIVGVALFLPDGLVGLAARFRREEGR